jgi:hypothetical protein
MSGIETTQAAAAEARLPLSLRGGAELGWRSLV